LAGDQPAVKGELQAPHRHLERGAAASTDASDADDVVGALPHLYPETALLGQGQVRASCWEIAGAGLQEIG